MSLPRFFPALCLSLLFGLLQLAGCATGVRPEAPVLDNRLQEQVTALEQAGNHSAAAELYQAILEIFLIY